MRRLLHYFFALSLFCLSVRAVGQENIPSILTVQRGLNNFEFRLVNSGDIPLTNIRATLRGIEDDVRVDARPIDRLEAGERAVVGLSVWVDHRSTWNERKASIEVSSAEAPAYYRDVLLRLAVTTFVDFHLAPAFPNPFNFSTIILYRLPAGSENEQTTLAIYDIRGRKIKTLVQQKQQGGEYRIPWDGTDNMNSPVASGIYYIRLSSGPLRSTNKIVHAK
jgi:hypothetical protein